MPLALRDGQWQTSTDQTTSSSLTPLVDRIRRAQMIPFVVAKISVLVPDSTGYWSPDLTESSFLTRFDAAMLGLEECLRTRK